MTEPKKPQKYRDIIDALVEMCHHGQGQIGARNARRGVWNGNPIVMVPEDQQAINKLLARLSPAERDTLARMLTQEVETGVFETLKALEEHGITPFEDGYEGSPFHDFVGRLTDWKWPER